MWKINIVIFMFFTFNICANDNLFNEYNILYNDLVNFDTHGYKSSWNTNNYEGSGKINMSQGALIETGFNTSFTIIGEGFFKICLENDVIGYTRSGDFHIGFGDSDFTLVTKNGHKLCEPIIIPRDTVDVFLEKNTLFALLPDGTIIETGKINVYEIKAEVLIRYNDSVFITLNNFDSQTLLNSKIISGFLELSNVSVLETLMRMNIILCELKNYGYNFDDRNQLILMLINNIPILNELITIRIELLNIHEKLISKEDELLKAGDITTIINGQELIFPRIFEQMKTQKAFSEVGGNNLLKRSLNFLKIE